MALTVSPAVKIFALLGVLVTLALGAGMFVLGAQAEGNAVDEPIVLPKKKSGLLETPEIARNTAAGASKRATKLAPAEPKAAAKPKAEAKVAPKPVPKPKPVVAANGLPTMLVSALAASPVVVVSLFDDAAKVDPLAHDEAEAGAKLAGAGFVSLDVTRHPKAAEALMLKLGTVLRAPMILVYVGHGDLVLQLDGFRDRDTVAQAAMNARR